MSRDLAVVVPVRSLSGGKTRLAGVLSPAEREVVVRRMLSHALATVEDAGIARHTLVISPDPAARRYAGAAGATTLAQTAAAPGLNAAIALGRDHAVAHGIASLLVLFADLPLVRAADLRRLVADDAPVIISPDRHGAGTNALLLRLDRGAATFAPRFGEGSAAAHRAEAAGRGLVASTASVPGIAFDLDTPEDWWAFHDIAPDVADRWGLPGAGAPSLAGCAGFGSFAEAAW
jgi:2-phospho-L-lactate guanylyltransferase